MTIPGGVAPCAGITYVGVMPTHRRRGVLTRAHARQLDDLHRRGEPLAALWASEPVIYGRFGYGIASPAASMEAEHAGFAFRDDPGPSGTVRLLTKDEARKLFPPIYERARLQRQRHDVPLGGALERAASKIPSTGATARARSTTSSSSSTGRARRSRCTASRRSGSGACRSRSSCSWTRSRRPPRQRASSGATSSASTSSRR